MTKVEDIENKLLDFAKELGETQGEVKALDTKVKAIDEKVNGLNDTMSSVSDKIDTLSNKVIEALAVGETRDIEIQKQISTLVNINNDLSDKNQELDKKVWTRRILLWCIAGVGILGFIGGSVIKWSKVENFFERTTMEQRADMVKKSAETIGTIAK